MHRQVQEEHAHASLCLDAHPSSGPTAVSSVSSNEPMMSGACAEQCSPHGHDQLSPLTRHRLATNSPVSSHAVCQPPHTRQHNAKSSGWFYAEETADDTPAPTAAYVAVWWTGRPCLGGGPSARNL